MSIDDSLSLFLKDYLWDLYHFSKQSNPDKHTNQTDFNAIYSHKSNPPDIPLTASEQAEQSESEKVITPEERPDDFCKPIPDKSDTEQPDSTVNELVTKCLENPLSPYCEELPTILQTNIEPNEEKSDNEISSDTFVYPGTPDTENDFGEKYKDSPTFYKDWTDCFAGPDHSKCNCNFTYWNDLNPPSPQCKFGKKIIFAVQQRIAAEYLDPSSPYRGLLCYHGLGSGKTLLIASVISKYVQKNPTRTIIVLLKPSLVQNFYDDLNKVDAITLFGEDMDEKTLSRNLRDRVNAITFEAFANRLNGKTKWDMGVNKATSQKLRKGITVEKKGNGFGALPDGTVSADSEKEPMMNNTIILIDEAHNLVTPKDAGYPKNPDDAYSVLNAIRNAKTCKTVLLTATPMRNEPFEIGVLVNMLKHKDSKTRFPEVYTKDSPKTMTRAKVNILDPEATKKAFNDMFYTVDESTGIRSIQNEDLFIQKCKGLVSFFPVDNIYTKFAKKNLLRVNVPLPDDVYAETRKNWVSDFKGLHKNNQISCVQSDKLCIASRKKNDVNMATNYAKIAEFSKKRENVPKIHAIADKLDEKYSEGKQFVYTYFNETIHALSTVLKQNGWIELDAMALKKYIKKSYQSTSSIGKANFEKQFKKYNSDDVTKIPTDCIRERALEQRKCFVVLGRDTTDLWKEKLVKIFFNLYDNTRGDRINLCIGNRKYSEGISLMSIRNIHIVEPATSEGLMAQVMGRGIRNCSHDNNILTFPTDWVVNIFSYYNTSPATTQFEIPNTTIVNPIEEVEEPVPIPTDQAIPSSTEQPLNAFSTEHILNAAQNLKATGGKRYTRTRALKTRYHTKKNNMNFTSIKTRNKYQKRQSYGGSEGEDPGEINYTKYTVVQLKDACRTKGLPISGTKAVLIARLGGKDSGSGSATKKKGATTKQDVITEWCTNHNENQCSQYDACAWQNNKCVTLGLDDMVKKMAVNQSRLNDRFLELLQLSAVDCNTFKQLHDDPSRTCFVSSNSDPSIDKAYEDSIRQYNGFNQKSDEGTVENQVSSYIIKDINVLTVKNDNCKTLNSLQCNIAPNCYISGSNCEPKKEPFGSNHGKCNIYYSNAKQCTSDPMCQWSYDDYDELGCQSRYLTELIPNSIAIEDSSRTSVHNPVFKVHSLYEKDTDLQQLHFLEENIEPQFTTRQSLTTDSSTELVMILNQLALHLQHGNDAYKTKLMQPNYLKDVFLKDYTKHKTDWFSPSTRATLARIAALLSQQKKEYQLNLSTRELKKSKKEHNLIDMWNKKNCRVMHYSFCVAVDNSLYYFHSSERDDAPLFLSGVHQLKKIIKYIQIHDINIKCVFYVIWNAIEKIELNCVKWNSTARSHLNRSMKVEKLSYSDVFAPDVNTILLHKNDDIIQLLDNARCGDLWDKSKSSFPQEFNCQNIPRVITSKSTLKNCNQNLKSGSLQHVPNNMSHTQAAQCYYRWLEPTKRPVTWQKYTKKKHAATEKLVKNSFKQKICKNDDVCMQKLHENDKTIAWDDSPVNCDKWYQCNLKSSKKYNYENFNKE